MIIASLLVSALASFSLVSAGEIVLYTGNTCDSTSRIVFSANTTTSCQQYDLTSNFNRSASTSRNIGTSCTFSLYKDTKCASLITKITSSGPLKSCLPLGPGAQSYKVACAGHVKASLTRPKDDSIYDPDYLQAPASYRGKPSGDAYFGTYLGIRGGSLTKKPTGDPSSIGIKLASAMFSKVPSSSTSYAYTVSAADGGTLYTVLLTGYKGNKYSVEFAARTMGYAAFASLMADLAEKHYRQPASYYYYDLDDYDLVQGELGSVNMTFVAP